MSAAHRCALSSLGLGKSTPAYTKPSWKRPERCYLLPFLGAVSGDPALVVGDERDWRRRAWRAELAARRWPLSTRETNACVWPGDCRKNTSISTSLGSADCCGASCVWQAGELPAGLQRGLGTWVFPLATALVWSEAQKGGLGFSGTTRGDQLMPPRLWAVSGPPAPRCWPQKHRIWFTIPVNSNMERKLTC